MKVAVYARVSTDAQAARGTIGSQLDTLRTRAAAAGHEVIATYTDDGHSGARLDRPGLDALRDAAEAGAFDAVWCLTPDRLARNYAYQLLVTEELARLGVTIYYSDATGAPDDPQAKLLTQIQGVVAEYERAKIAERYRRGKLWRARCGEPVAWQAPYGYRRVPRSAAGPARLEIHDPEAAVVRVIFGYHTTDGLSMRQITRRLADDGVASPSGKPVWPISTISALLTNDAYHGTWYYNRSEALPATGPTGAAARRDRPRDEWIGVPVPAIISDDTFAAAQAVTRDNTRFSPRRATPDAWLLRGLVRCGVCQVTNSCRTMTSGGTVHRYYWCPYHDPLRAGGEHRRCPERHIRADELDAFAFDQVRGVLLRPDVLTAGQTAVAATAPVPDDELLATQLHRLQRRIDHAAAERRRLLDLFQTGLIDMPELQRRAADVDARHTTLKTEHAHLRQRHDDLAHSNQLRQRLHGFAQRATVGIDTLGFTQRQRLLRLVVDHVAVTGWHVDIHLRIPLDTTQ